MSANQLITPVSTGGTYTLDTASWRDYRPVLDQSKCIACGVCLGICPVCSISRQSDASGKKFVISYDYCKGCGLCAYECPKKAIAMEPEAQHLAAEGGL